MGGQAFMFSYSLFFFFMELGGLDNSFHIFYAKKITVTFLMHSLIALKFGTNKKHIKVNSATEFGINLITIQSVRSADSRRK